MEESPLLSLPTELRLHIYSYLAPRETCRFPVRAVDVASVSYRPPSISLLLVNRAISTEVLEYFMSHAVWKINVQYSFNFFRLDPDLDGFDQWPALRHVRHVELLVTLDGHLMGEYPSLGLDKYCAELANRAAKACKALRDSRRLQSVLVSFKDSSRDDAWAVKQHIFEALAILPKHLSIRCGLLTGPSAAHVREVLPTLQSRSASYALAMPRATLADWHDVGRQASGELPSACRATLPRRGHRVPQLSVECGATTSSP